jgi:F0F1-type ATP synthase membrane subunit c/vacuolar-type H+-ATPase subunit K
MSVFVVTLASFLVTVFFLTDPADRWRADLEQDWALWILVAGAAASLLGVGWARGRPLSGTTPQALLGSYNTRFWVGMAFAESAALIGFIVVFVTKRMWPYLAGLAVSLAGFAMIAPTARSIGRDEGRLRAAGSPVSLWDALTLPPDRSPSGTP